MTERDNLPKINIIEGLFVSLFAMTLGFFLGAWAFWQNAAKPEPSDGLNPRLQNAIDAGVGRAAEEAAYRKALEHYMATDKWWLDREMGVQP